MSLVEQFGPHLPFLRRYARALTGSQESGDSYIRASLTALAEDPSQVSDELPARQALYRFFHVIWGSTGARLERPDASSVTPETRLQSLAPIERQAFLLTALEGFTVDDVAYLIGMDASDVEALVEEALTEIEAQTRAKVLIIEDEPIIAMDIETIVRDLGHEVTAIAVTREDAVREAMAERPGLVLADIQLADDSSGIDAVKDILSEISVPVIFITAFPERLLTGERPEPAFLISKPYSEDQVRSAVSQAMFFSSTETLKA